MNSTRFPYLSKWFISFVRSYHFYLCYGLFCTVLHGSSSHIYFQEISLRRYHRLRHGWKKKWFSVTSNYLLEATIKKRPTWIKQFSFISFSSSFRTGLRTRTHMHVLVRVSMCVHICLFLHFNLIRLLWSFFLSYLINQSTHSLPNKTNIAPLYDSSRH